MKKLVVAFLLMGIYGFAQEIKSQKQLTLDQRVEKRLEHLKKDLNLNSQQEKQVRQALIDQEARVAALNGKKKEPGQKLTMQEKVALKSQVKKEQETMAAKLKAILTPEQFKKWDAGKDQRSEELKKQLKGLQ